MALPTTDTAGTWNKVVYQGDTFTWSFSVETGEEGSELPVDLTGVVITMTVKKARGATVAVLWTGTTTGGDITVGGGGNNVVTITISATDMADIPAGSWVYDVQFRDGTQIETYLTGAFTVTAEVTP
jgi:hypothetical protein